MIVCPVCKTVIDKPRRNQIVCTTFGKQCKNRWDNAVRVGQQHKFDTTMKFDGFQVDMFNSVLRQWMEVRV